VPAPSFERIWKDGRKGSNSGKREKVPHKVLASRRVFSVRKRDPHIMAGWKFLNALRDFAEIVIAHSMAITIGRSQRLENRHVILGARKDSPRDRLHLIYGFLWKPGDADNEMQLLSADAQQAL
jgi:hypothetical protein